MKHLQGHMGTTPDESMDVTDRNPNQNQWYQPNNADVYRFRLSNPFEAW
jgi:hypothetical protein